MKILFIASRFPVPAIKGDQTRVLNFLKHLSKKHEIYFVCTFDTEYTQADYNEVKRYVKELYIFRLRRWERLLNLILSPVSLLPFQVMFFHSREVGRQVREILSRVKVDIIFCQMVRSAPYVEDIWDVPKVIDFQDAYSLNMERRFRSEKGIVRWIALIEWILMRRYERRLAREFDLATTVSTRDQKVIGRSDKIKIVPIGINPKDYSQDKQSRKLIFSGNLKYFPNRDAITWFVKEVLPLIKKKITVSLDIVGANPPPDVLALEKKDASVKVIANVPEIGPYLAQAELAVAPMRSGSGSQFKVIEALNAGTAVVVTNYAKEGLEFLSNKALVTTEANPKKFAGEIISLLSDKKRLVELSLVGKNEVRRHYSWESVANKLEQSFLEAKSRFEEKKFFPIGYHVVLPLLTFAVILIIGGLLRFYQIDSNVYMGGDEGRDVHTVSQIIETKKPVLQGPPTSITTDIGRVYYGPGYYYVAIPFFFLTQGHPASIYVATAFFGFLGILFTYLLGRELFGDRGALVSSALYAFSVYLVEFERWAWSPNWIPFFTVLLLYGIVKLGHGKSWGAYIVATALAVGWQLHYTFLFLSVILAVVIWRFKVRLNRKTILFASLLFFLISSPLIINEFRYEFPNSKVLLYYIFEQAKPVLSLPEKITDTAPVILNMLQSSLFSSSPFTFPMLILGIGALAWELIWNKKSLVAYTLILWPLLVIVPISLMYNGEIPFDDRFVMAILPWPFLLAGFTVEKLRKEIVLEGVVLLMVFSIVVSNLNTFGLLNGKFLSRPTSGLADMMRAVDHIQERSLGEPILFDYHASGGTYPSAYYFLMKWRGVEVGPNARKEFSLYERNPGDIEGKSFGPILVIERDL